MVVHWRDLKVWQKAHALVLEVYRVTAHFPKEEAFGLTNQLRRAASSAPANIAEGQSRQSTKEYIKFLFNARGSLEEVRYFLLLSKDLNIINDDVYQSLEIEYQNTSKMLNSLIKSLKTKIN
jgi:four helix bundle protein